METITHKTLGKATIIDRTNDIITIEYENGTRAICAVPKPFMNDVFTLEPGSLKDEVDAAIKAKNAETAATVRRIAESSVTSSTTRTTRAITRPAKNPAEKHIQNEYEAYLISEGYSVETPVGNPSTVTSYAVAVEKVCANENLTWQELAEKISEIIPIYDVGGAKEHIGNKSNRTIINALYRYAEFTDSKISKE